MNRRDTMKALVAASGALISLPSWAEAWTPAELGIESTSLPVVSQETLAAVADTIIPGGNAIGALSVGVDKFLQKLFADCYEKEIQDNIQKQLNGLDSIARTLHGQSFRDCTQVQRQDMLSKLSASADPSEQDFFKLVKSETIRGFSTSREVMVNYHRFRQVPGHYFGCIDVNA